MSQSQEQIDDVLWAARAGDLEALQETMSTMGADDKARVRAALSCVNEAGNSPLHYASANGHLDIVQAFLKEADLASLLRQNEAGNTPLHWAAFNGHVELAAALVDRIEALEKVDTDAASQLRKQEDSKEHARHQAAGKDIDEADTDRAAELAHHDELQKGRALWDIRNEAGRGPMSEAQMLDHEDMVQMLLGRLAQHDKQEPAAAPEETSATDVTSQAARMSMSDNGAAP